MSTQDNSEAEALLRRALIFEVNVNYPELTAHDVEQLLVQMLHGVSLGPRPISEVMAHPSFPKGFIEIYKASRGLA